uniref:Uncharacterized protein n=1 Tax=Solanum lycopersicum TaxID=4081 RepID=A0A3Q7FHX2_SOLLC
MKTDYFDFLLDVVIATDPFTPSSVPFYAVGGNNREDRNKLDHLSIQLVISGTFDQQAILMSPCHATTILIFLFSYGFQF